MIATATYSHNYLIVCTLYYCLSLYDVSERTSRSGTGTKVTVSLAWLRKRGRFSLVCDCRLGLAWIHDMNHIGKIVKLALINELQRNLVLHGFGVLMCVAWTCHCIFMDQRRERVTIFRVASWRGRKRYSALQSMAAPYYAWAAQKACSSVSITLRGRWDRNLWELLGTDNSIRSSGFRQVFFLLEK